MWKERKKVVGESYNPFTKRYEKVFDIDNKEKIWVSPKGHDKEKIVTNYKAVCSGNVIEIYNYEEPLFYGFDNSNNGIGKGKKKVGDKADFIKRRDNMMNSKMKLRRLINANVKKYSKFVTLTFAENVQDVDSAKDIFKKFIKKLNYRRKKEGKQNLKYVYVVEFQKRGSIHFHCVFFNMGFIKNEELQRLWGKGYTKINIITNVDNVGAYVVKYMEKSLEDNRLNGKDLYGRSKGNLEESLVIKQPREVTAILEAYQNNITFEKTYKTDYNGKVQYYQIKLPRD